MIQTKKNDLFEKRINMLANETIFFSRVGFAQDPTRTDAEGNVLFYDEDWGKYIEEHKNFLEKGIKLHETIIHNGWICPERYDYSAVDKTLEAVCGISQEILYIPRIKLNVPIEWCKENPTEVFLTENAPSDIEGIKRLIDKLSSYYMTSGLKDNAPREGGIAGLQSFFSKKWVKDASIALEKLINHIENSKFGKQILGYHIGFGMCAENSCWGGWGPSEYWGDFSDAAQNGFYQYCLKKYGSDKKIKEAFGLKEIGNPIHLVPSHDKRCCTPGNLETYFRCGNEVSIAYTEALSDATVTAMQEFARVIKGVCPHKPVGVFYGYLYTATPGETGHLGIEKLMGCEEIDFVSSPKGYYRCKAGEPGGAQAASLSISKKKIWIDELDNGTHITKPTHNPKNCPTTMEETRTVLWREAMRNLSWNNQNFWWMDLAGGCFLDNQIMDEIEKIQTFVNKIRQKKWESVSEILFVIDDNSLLYLDCDQNIMGAHHKGIMNEMAAELRLCGTAVDEYRLSDLKEIPMEHYKMIVFANAFVVDEEMRSILHNRIPSETLCIWNYAAGIRKPEYSLKNVQELTGMSIKPYEGERFLNNGYGVEVKMPPIQIVEEKGVEILSLYADGKIKMARKGRNILCASPDLRAKNFYKLALEAGCRMYAESPCTVYTDSRFVGIFPGEGNGVQVNFREEWERV